MKRFLCLLTVFSLVFMFLGCNFQNEEDKASNQTSDYLCFEDSLGRRVSLEKKPERVAVLFSSFASVWTLAGGVVDISVYESVDYRVTNGAELVLAFVSVGSAAAEAKESSDVDAVVDARGLYRILVCSDAAPSAECTAALERFPMPAVSGKYGRLLEPLAKNDDADFEPVTVTADSRELRCALCQNLGQARRAIEAGGFDVIRVIS